MAELEAFGVRYNVHPDVYDPSDDTFLLAAVVRRLRPGNLLEIGTGTGFVAITAALAGHKVAATDLNPHALRLARKNAVLNGVHVDLVRCDLGSAVRPQPFDVIVFNPPYLPTGEGDRVPGLLNHAFDGGPTGLRVIERFITALAQQGAPAILIASSLQGEGAAARLASAHGFDPITVGEKAMGLERLEALLLRPRAPPRKG